MAIKLISCLVTVLLLLAAEPSSARTGSDFRNLNNNNLLLSGSGISYSDFDFDENTGLYGESSLVGGVVPMYFHYDGVTWFNDTGYMAILGSPKSNLLVGFGETDDLFTQSSLRTIRANLQLGGNAYLWRRFLRLPLSIYVPIRLNAGYQHLSLDVHESDRYMSEVVNLDDKDFLNLNLGAGVGASFRLPLDDIPLIGSEISLDGYFIRSPGVMIHFLDDENGLSGQNGSGNEIGAAVSNDLLLQARVHRFLESTIGVTAGVRFSGLDWSAESFDFMDALDMLIGDEVPENRLEYTLFFIGFNW